MLGKHDHIGIYDVWTAVAKYIHLLCLGEITLPQTDGTQRSGLLRPFFMAFAAMRVHLRDAQAEDYIVAVYCQAVDSNGGLAEGGARMAGALAHSQCYVGT